MPVAIRLAPVGGGRYTPSAPTLTYRGSGTSNLGKFQVTNYDATFQYDATGGTLAYDAGLAAWVFTVTASTGSGVLKAKSAKGLTFSASVTAYRHVADQTYVAFTQCYNPCGNCRTDVNPHTWSCGCGSGCNDSGGGAWGDCICRGPGYSYWNNYSGSGYAWSGSDYTNGSGEWWKIA